jgi:hypothetical protein
VVSVSTTTSRSIPGVPDPASGPYPAICLEQAAPARR